MNEGFPKFQWSIFLPNGKDQQFVVRANTIEDLKTARNEVMAVIGQAVTTVVTQQVGNAAPMTEAKAHGNTQQCPIHNVTMYEKNGQYGTFYSHKTESGYCNGRQR